MGPLIPQGLITGQWDFVIALLIGMAFGFILEATGFSSSRNIAGVFYGYNFVVLRVFSTCPGAIVSTIVTIDNFITPVALSPRPARKKTTSNNKPKSIPPK